MGATSVWYVSSMLSPTPEHLAWLILNFSLHSNSYDADHGDDQTRSRKGQIGTMLDEYTQVRRMVPS